MARFTAHTQPSVPGNVGAGMQAAAKKVALTLLGAAAVVSLLLVVSTDKPRGGKDLGVGVTLFALCAAAGTVGGILGFLFGLPRGRLSDEQVTPSADAKGGQEGAQTNLASAHYLTNTNLNKVSDWLTTIVIGLGLVNLVNALPAARSLSGALEAPLGGAPYAGVLGIASMTASFIGGFLILYLFTMIRVRQLLEETDQLLELREVVEQHSEAAPPLVGLTLDEAQRVIARTPLRIAADPDADPRGLVRMQTPAPGSMVLAGTQVAVDVAPAANSPDVPIGAEAVPTQHTRESDVADPTQDGGGATVRGPA